MKTTTTTSGGSGGVDMQLVFDNLNYQQQGGSDEGEKTTGMMGDETSIELRKQLQSSLTIHDIEGLCET